MLYSLVNVNQRFDRLVLNPFYIQHLDLTVKPLLSHNSLVNNQIFDRIRTQVLPQIHHKVNKFTVEPLSIGCILGTIDYSELNSLSLVNFQSETLLQYLTSDTILRLLTDQITHLTVDIPYKISEIPGGNELNMFALTLSISKCLIDLTFTERTKVSFSNLPSTSCVSSTVTELKITVSTFDDCLYLLDGRLQHLSILIIHIIEISDSSLNIDNTINLPKLKCLTLASYWYTYVYSNRIVPLLRRMLNLEALTLFLSIIGNELTYIDGTRLHNDFLINMPRLNKFIFSIHTHIINDHIEINLPSKSDILNSFIERGYQQVDSYADEKLTYNRGYCHVYSLPYHFNDFIFMTSGFQGGTFNKVRWLVMLDIRPFENELFQVISQGFPFLQKLFITNLQSQKTNQHSSTFITFPYLFELDLKRAHLDYAVQFLFDKNTSLPRLTHLTIRYETLATATLSFTNDAARLTCAKIKCLVVQEPFVRSEKFLSYFSSL
ncbi:unnamed protein product [Rotaria sp. Silwood2]|nr:unnamed protein product [Rotaria sp. Silwood2]CAF4487136.1 unnamed protein product [Rotaria sp. Silwood2]